jgi:predicted HAD superfamily phosphohydrolase YqeG
MNRPEALSCFNDDWATISGALRDHHIASVVVDVEPLVAIWNSGDEELASGLTMLIERLAELPEIETVSFATNSKRAPRAALEHARLRLTYVHSAGKPWLRLDVLRRLPRPLAVIGDQGLTDGLLAWRLNALFINLVVPADSPHGVRFQAAAGQLVRRIFFS